MYIDKAPNIEEAEEIEQYFRRYGAEIRIEKFIVCPDGKRRIYHVMPVGNTKIDSILNLGKEVRLQMGMELFTTFMDNGALCIALAEDANMDNNLAEAFAQRTSVGSREEIEA